MLVSTMVNQDVRKTIRFFWTNQWLIYWRFINDESILTIDVIDKPSVGY